VRLAVAVIFVMICVGIVVVTGECPVLITDRVAGVVFNTVHNQI